MRQHRGQEFDFLEFYAGNANLSRMMKLSGFRVGKLDLLYGPQVPTSGKRHGSNPMDLLGDSGFALLSIIYVRSETKYQAIRNKKLAIYI